MQSYAWILLQMLPCLAFSISINWGSPSQLWHSLLYLSFVKGSVTYSLMAFFTEKGAGASASASASFLVLMLCMVVFHEVSDCTTGSGCFYANAAHSHSRKTMAGFKEKEVAQGFLHRSTSTGNRESFVGWELRTVPSGPDPLHHNGGSPKKPRTP